MENEWWQEELAVEIHDTLREKELTLPPYKGQSPLIWMRRYFVDFLALLSKHYELCSSTQHLAVYLLDLLMDRCDANAIELYSISVVSLLLACKFEERRDKVPMLEDLNRLSHAIGLCVVLTKHDLLKIEVWILKTINWNLCLPTPTHFIDYYLHASVTVADRCKGFPITYEDETRYSIKKYSDYFLEVSLQDHAFLSFRPSLVASACVAASRICLEITPKWPVLLSVITQYSWENIDQCVHLMLVAHENDIRAAQKERQQVVLFQQQRHMESLTFQSPARVLFQPSPRCYLQAQHQDVPTYFQSPIPDLFASSQAPLQALQSNRLALENSSLLPSVSTAQATFEMVPPQTIIQGHAVMMQVAISEDPAQYLSLILGNSFFSTYDSHTADCVEDEQSQ